MFKRVVHKRIVIIVIGILAFAMTNGECKPVSDIFDLLGFKNMDLKEFGFKKEPIFEFKNEHGELLQQAELEELSKQPVDIIVVLSFEFVPLKSGSLVSPNNLGDCWQDILKCRLGDLEPCFTFYFFPNKRLHD